VAVEVVAHSWVVDTGLEAVSSVEAEVEAAAGPRSVVVEEVDD